MLSILLNIDWSLTGELLFELIIASGALGAIFGILRRAWLWIRNSRAKAEIHKVLIRKYTLYDILQSTLSYIGGQRGMLLRLENNGHVPEVTSVLYSTIIEEAYNPPLKSVKHAWQKRLVDIEYIKMILLMGKGDSCVITKEMPDDSILKDLYLANNITCAEIKYVTTTNKYMYYVSFNFTEPKKLNPAERDSLNSLVSSIKDLI